MFTLVHFYSMAYEGYGPNRQRVLQEQFRVLADVWIREVREEEIGGKVSIIRRYGIRVNKSLMPLITPSMVVEIEFQAGIRRAEIEYIERLEEASQSFVLSAREIE